MSGIWERIVTDAGEERLRSTGLEIPGALQDLDNLGSTLGPGELVAVVAWAGLGPEGTAGPGLVASRPARPGLRRWIEVAGQRSGAPEPARLTLEAGLLQVLDFWDASHEAAQRAEDQGERSDSAYWHGIAHRREPDAGNASYWFRRVGRHPVFETLADGVRMLPQVASEPAWLGRVRAGGAWEPLEFIGWCGRVGRDQEAEALARRIQRLEMRVLLEHTAGLCGV